MIVTVKYVLRQFLLPLDLTSIILHREVDIMIISPSIYMKCYGNDLLNNSWSPHWLFLYHKRLLCLCIGIGDIFISAPNIILIKHCVKYFLHAYLSAHVAILKFIWKKIHIICLLLRFRLILDKVTYFHLFQLTCPLWKYHDSKCICQFIPLCWWPVWQVWNLQTFIWFWCPILSL